MYVLRKAVNFFKAVINKKKWRGFYKISELIKRPTSKPAHNKSHATELSPVRKHNAQVLPNWETKLVLLPEQDQLGQK